MKKLLLSSLIFILIYGCSDENTPTPTPDSPLQLNIGDAYKGGKIAYILQPGDPGYISGETHGLRAATSDFDVDQYDDLVKWWNGSYTNTGATGELLGTGKVNTDKIIASQGNTGNYAAKLCADYSVIDNGITYNDWYLPSKNELFVLYLSNSILGGYTPGSYWSSTESGNMALLYLFDYGSSGNVYYGYYDKEDGSRVRAIRAF